MASIEEIVTSLQAAIDELNKAISATAAAESDADEMINTMSAAGVEDKVQQFSAVKDAAEKTRTYLAGGIDMLDETINLAKAAGGG